MASSDNTPSWTARILSGPPLIAPARSFIYPRPVPGEEDAMARGSVWIEVKPSSGGAFLAQCAIGFQGGGVATGIYASPISNMACLAAGGYAYMVDTLRPEEVMQIPLRPVVQVIESEQWLVFVGFHTLYLVGLEQHWETPRLSYEGISDVRVESNLVKGLGWDLMADAEVPFTVDLSTRACRGGGFRL